MGHGPTPALTYFGLVLPFALRRPFLILRDLFARRERPDLERLAGIHEPEAFVWAILPHAARTFSSCIALLPARSALPAAVAYLYCRMLDTYEDLVPDPAAREAALEAFATRLDAAVERPSSEATLRAAPVIQGASDRDDRDRAHLLLVGRAHLVDQVFLSFDAPTRRVVRDLVRDMAVGMCWSSRTFAAQGGVLVGENQLAEYCRHVLGNPVVFGMRLVRLERGRVPELSPAEHEDAMRVGEMVQLANITRDVEKDLRRGIAYDEALRHDLGRDVRRPPFSDDPALLERCRAVRERLLHMALARAVAYRRIMNAMDFPKLSVARASAVLMLLFTERYFRSCARRVGLPAWRGPSATLRILFRTIPTSFSPRAAYREVDRIEREFLEATQFSAAADAAG
jgi:farnesyl-diphosphate farnesyltransferase